VAAGFSYIPNNARKPNGNPQVSRGDFIGEEAMNRYRCLLVIALLLAAPMARASATWYVDAANGNDTNDCQSPASACRTIGHAISLASSGDSIVLAAATYAENLTLKFSINIFGSSATTTIIDGGRHSSVLWISSTGANIRLCEWAARRHSGRTWYILF
jgi:hypothetical protein